MHLLHVEAPPATLLTKPTISPQQPKQLPNQLQLQEEDDHISVRWGDGSHSSRKYKYECDDESGKTDCEKKDSNNKNKKLDTQCVHSTGTPEKHKNKNSRSLPPLALVSRGESDLSKISCIELTGGLAGTLEPGTQFCDLV